MAKQTNSFQQLVRRVHEVYEGPGASVVESAQELEPDGTCREVDVLVETRVGGRPARIAIECRDRRGAQTIEWIDGVLGKYADLNVDKVVLVARNGYSAAAQRKALRKGIELWQLDEISDIDAWPNLITKLWLVPYTEKSHIAATFEFSDPVPLEGVRELRVDVVREDLFAEFAYKVWRARRDADEPIINSMRPSLGDLVQPLRTKVEVVSPLPNEVKLLMNGREIGVSKVFLSVYFRAFPVVAEHSRFLMEAVGRAAPSPLRAITEVRFFSGGKPVLVTFVQDEERGFFVGSALDGST